MSLGTRPERQSLSSNNTAVPDLRAPGMLGCLSLRTAPMGNECKAKDQTLA